MGKLSNEENVCHLCKNIPCTARHILTGCKVTPEEGRYTYRHDKVLQIVREAVSLSIASRRDDKMNKITFVRQGGNPKNVLNTSLPSLCLMDWRILMDVNNFHYMCPLELYVTSLCPDILACSAFSKLVLVLTVPRVDNIPGQNLKKTQRYEELVLGLNMRGFQTNFFAIEVGAKGLPDDFSQGDLFGSDTEGEESIENVNLDDYIDEKPKRKMAKYPEDFGVMDLRVGKIMRADPNPYSKKKTYLQNIDIGETITRLVVSDLSRDYELDQLVNRMVIVACNVRRTRKRGLIHEAWMLCAKSGKKRELLDPPLECEQGDQVTVEGYPSIPKLRKKERPRSRVLEGILKDLRVNSEKVVVYRGIPLRVGDKNNCITTATFADCPITDCVKWLTPK